MIVAAWVPVLTRDTSHALALALAALAALAAAAAASSTLATTALAAALTALMAAPAVDTPAALAVSSSRPFFLTTELLSDKELALQRCVL